MGQKTPATGATTVYRSDSALHSSVSTVMFTLFGGLGVLDLFGFQIPTPITLHSDPDSSLSALKQWRTQANTTQVGKFMVVQSSYIGKATSKLLLKLLLSRGYRCRTQRPQERHLLHRCGSTPKCHVSWEANHRLKSTYKVRYWWWYWRILISYLYTPGILYINVYHHIICKTVRLCHLSTFTSRNWLRPGRGAKNRVTNLHGIFWILLSSSVTNLLYNSIWRAIPAGMDRNHQEVCLLEQLLHA